MKTKGRVYAISAAVVLGAGLTLAIAGPKNLNAPGQLKKWFSGTDGQTGSGGTSGDTGTGSTSSGDAGDTTSGGTASGETGSGTTTGSAPPNTILQLSWQPNPDVVAGYLVYYGLRPDDTPTLASDLSVSSSAFNAQAPAVNLDSGSLGLSAGANVCFRIRAYNDSRTMSGWSEPVCETI